MRAVWLWMGAAFLTAAPLGNMSGTWHLNVEKSQWGTTKKPHSVVLTLEHKEPFLKYQGTVVYANEDSRDFSFEGAVDGKEYPMVRSYGPGMITLKRVDVFTIESVYKSTDGEVIETTRTTLSMDGKSMTRKYRTRSPEGTKTWTEVYDKR
jgi:hypothetical protein